MILVVAGGRTYQWSSIDRVVLLNLFDYLGVQEVWTGGAIGVDTHAGELAKHRGLSVRVFLPQPVLLPEDAELAGVRRNAVMMDELDATVHQDGKMGCVVAFPGEDGTDNAVRHALRRHLHVIDLRARALTGIQKEEL